jgi:hypothetical protein
MNSSTTISQERHLLIQLLKWLKRERSENMATLSALQIAGHVAAKVANTILEEKAAQMPQCERVADAEFRQVESALVEGENYVPALESLLKRHSPES